MVVARTCRQTLFGVLVHTKTMDWVEPKLRVRTTRINPNAEVLQVDMYERVARSTGHD